MSGKKSESKSKKNASENPKIRVDELAKKLPKEAFQESRLKVEKPRSLWVATVEIELSNYPGLKVIALVGEKIFISQCFSIENITNIGRVEGGFVGAQAAPTPLHEITIHNDF
jgi:hypothetical protein